MTDRTPETEEDLQEILSRLNEDQLRFVAVRIYCRTDAEAARKLMVNPGVIYSWDNKQDVNDAVRLAQRVGVEVSRERLYRLVVKALDVLDSEMDNKRNRLAAAIQVLDRAGLPATQQVKQENSGVTEIIVRRESDE